MSSSSLALAARGKGRAALRVDLSRQLRVARAVVSTLCVLLFVPNVAICQEVVEEPRTPIELDVDLKAQVTVAKDGTSHRKGSNGLCSSGRPRPSRKPISGTDTAVITLRERILQNASHTSVAEGPPVLINTGGEGIKKAPNPNSLAAGWRTLTLSNSVSNLSDGQIVELKIRDVISSQKKKESKSRGLFRELCWHRKWREQVINDTLTGSLSVTYQVPQHVDFVAFEVLQADGFFQSQHFGELVNSIHSHLSYVAPTYAWYRKSPEGRLKIEFRYPEPYKRGVGAGGLDHTSTFRIKIRPIHVPKDFVFADALYQLVDDFENDEISEDELVLQLGSMISRFRTVDGAEGSGLTAELIKLPLSEIRELQRDLFDLAIAGTSDLQAFTPTTKAMGAVLATLVAQELSDSLLRVCQRKTKTLTLTGQEVDAPLYVYLTFYVQRIIDRLNSYEPGKVYDFARILDEIESRNLSYQGVARQQDLMERLATAYDIYVVLASAAAEPLRTSLGEMTHLETDIGDFFTGSDHFREIRTSLKEGQRLEARIRTKIETVKRQTIVRPSAEAFASDAVWSDVDSLADVVRRSIAAVEAFSEASMFSEVTKTGFHESMLEIFKGVNLREIDFQDEEVTTFFMPIFSYFFDLEKIDEINERAKKCLKGELT